MKILFEKLENVVFGFLLGHLGMMFYHYGLVEGMEIIMSLYEIAGISFLLFIGIGASYKRTTGSLVSYRDAFISWIIFVGIVLAYNYFFIPRVDVTLILFIVCTITLVIDLSRRANMIIIRSMGILSKIKRGQYMLSGAFIEQEKYLMLKGYIYKKERGSLGITLKGKRFFEILLKGKIVEPFRYMFLEELKCLDKKSLKRIKRAIKENDKPLQKI